MKRICNEMLIDENWISQKEYDYLVVRNPVLPVFYMLPNGAIPMHGTAWYGSVRFTFGGC